MIFRHPYVVLAFLFTIQIAIAVGFVVTQACTPAQVKTAASVKRVAVAIDAFLCKEAETHDASAAWIALLCPATGLGQDTAAYVQVPRETWERMKAEVAAAEDAGLSQ